VRVRYRIDGVLKEIASLDHALLAPLTSRLKILAGLDIAEKRKPQDGRISLKAQGRDIDVRTSVLPGNHGETIVMRLLDKEKGLLTLDALGFDGPDRDRFERCIARPNGIVLVTGPTGSGKTTTLYTALHLLNDPGHVVMTIEDPVEDQIRGINHIEISPKSGLTFARGLRTILRSDPDVLLVGEIRDEETARIAMQAGMTGHLVLTTVHAHNAASAIERLKDMGVEPGLLASSVNCIVSQRLARRLCTDCREAYWPTDEELEVLGLLEQKGKAYLHRSEGCGRCGGTGYRGRVALYEVLPVTGEIRGLVGASTDEIFEAAVRGGMNTLRQDGLRLCLEGVSSLEEIRRVTGDRLG